MKHQRAQNAALLIAPGLIEHMPCPVRTGATACVTERLRRVFGVRTGGALRDRNSRYTALEPHSTAVRPLRLAQITRRSAKSLLHRYLAATPQRPGISTFLATPRHREPQRGRRGAPRENLDEAPGQMARACAAADRPSRVRIGPTAGSTAGGSSPPPGRCPPDQRAAPPRTERRLRVGSAQHPRGPGLSGRESRGGTPAGGAGAVARRSGQL